MASIQPAKILSQKSYQVAGKLKITEHFFEVPKDYSKPESGTIKLFARSARKHERPIVPESPKDESAKAKDQLPWMAYLQGGPGHPCRSPQNYAFTQAVLDKGYQLLCLDSRGTGLSTPITPSTLQMRGAEDVQASYLKLFRADSIVKDYEAIRKALTADYPEEKKQWSVMGQSFGGFCIITYLSFFPEGLREAFTYGGLQPLVKSPDEVYRRLYRKVIQRNKHYYEKYPEDVERVKTIMNYLKRFGDGKIKLPSEGALTRRRFQSIGIGLGMHGGVDGIHALVLKASNDIESFGHLTRNSLVEIDSATSFDTCTIYAILHEPIYCEGNAPNWSAHRLQDEYPEFALDKTDDSPIYLTGEMVFPHTFEDSADLQKIQDVANKLASDSQWPPLFDLEQLAKNEVPVYSASYVEDMYVNFDFAQETARSIKGCKVFTTNVMFHNAIGSRMDEVVKQAFSLREDVID